MDTAFDETRTDQEELGDQDDHPWHHHGDQQGSKYDFLSRKLDPRKAYPAIEQNNTRNKCGCHRDERAV